jgi:hypothetical protein
MASDNDGTSFWSQVWRHPRLIAGGATAFIAALGLLVSNETSSKHASDTLAQAQSEIRSTGAEAIDPSMQGKLISVSGAFSSKQGAVDPEFGVRSQGVALKRQVMMYQWVESSYTEGRRRNKRTVYEYAMDWSEEYQDSSKFNQPSGHTNPPMPMRSQVIVAPDAKLGAYQFTNGELLSAALPAQYGDYALADETEIAGSIVKSDLSGIAQKVTKLPSIGLRADQGWFAQEEDASYYKGDQSAQDYQLGDLYVSFTQIPNGSEVTLIGQQEGNEIKSWQSASGDKLFLAKEGRINAQQWLGDAVKASSENLSSQRWIGLFLATVGFAGFTAGLGAWLQNLPIFGGLLRFGLWIGGAVLGFTAGVVAIAVGWLSARPIVAFLIIAGIVGSICWRVFVVNKRIKAEQHAQSIAQAAELARQRQSERNNAGVPPPPPASAAVALSGVGVNDAAASALPLMPPPPPNSKSMPSQSDGFGKANMQVAPTVPDMLPNGDLPPLEWTFSSASKAPPAVMPKKTTSSAPSYGSQAIDSGPSEAARSGAPIPLQSAQASSPPTLSANAQASHAVASSAKPKAKREVLGDKGGFTLTKIVFIDGPQAGQIMCFELMKDKEVLTRGTQEEVKAAFRARLASA